MFTLPHLQCSVMEVDFRCRADTAEPADFAAGLSNTVGRFRRSRLQQPLLARRPNDGSSIITASASDDRFTAAVPVSQKRRSTPRSRHVRLNRNTQANRCHRPMQGTGDHLRTAELTRGTGADSFQALSLGAGLLRRIRTVVVVVYRPAGRAGCFPARCRTTVCGTACDRPPANEPFRHRTANTPF